MSNPAAGTRTLLRAAALALAGLGLAGCANVANMTGVLSGAPEPKYVSLPPAPLPSYGAGDSFVYRTETGAEAVRRVVRGGNTVEWVTETGYRFTTYRNIFLPPLAWDGPSSAGTMTSRLSPGQLWPLEPGRRADITVTYRKLNKKDGTTKPLTENWRCKVNRARAVTVPAGTFDAFKVICQRWRTNTGKVTRTHTWYYAPAVGHFVKRVKKYASGKTKTLELISFRRGSPS